VQAHVISGAAASEFGSVAIEWTLEGVEKSLTAEGVPKEPGPFSPSRAAQIAVPPPNVVPKTERACDVMIVREVEWW